MHVDLTVLKQLFNFAVRREMVDVNRLADLKLKRPKPTPQPCWTLEQVTKILKASVASPYHALFCILAWTALRIGEAKFLAWDDVDLENRVLRIRPKQIGPLKTDLWNPKSGDQRSVPLCEPAIRLLRALPRTCRWVFVRPGTTRGATADRQIDERCVLAHLKKVLASIGLKGHTHTLRAFTGYLCIAEWYS